MKHPAYTGPFPRAATIMNNRGGKIAIYQLAPSAELDKLLNPKRQKRYRTLWRWRIATPLLSLALLAVTIPVAWSIFPNLPHESVLYIVVGALALSPIVIGRIYASIVEEKLRANNELVAKHATGRFGLPPDQNVAINANDHYVQLFMLDRPEVEKHEDILRFIGTVSFKYDIETIAFILRLIERHNLEPDREEIVALRQWQAKLISERKRAIIEEVQDLEKQLESLHLTTSE